MLMKDSFGVLALVLLVNIGVTAAVRCFTCTNPTGECNTGECENIWCMEQVIRNQREGRYVVNKRCTDVNPLVGEREDCVKVTKGDTDSITCVCNSIDYCNTRDFLKKFAAMTDSSISTGTMIFGNLWLTTTPLLTIAAPDTNESRMPGFAINKQLQNRESTTSAPLVSSSSNNNTDNRNRSPSALWALSVSATSVQGSGVQCFQCQGSDDCSSGRCSGDWCVANIVKNDERDSMVLSKDCARENPLGLSKDGCTANRNIPGQVHIQCACKTALCNGREELQRLYERVNNGAKLFSNNSIFQSRPSSSGLLPDELVLGSLQLQARPDSTTSKADQFGTSKKPSHTTVLPLYTTVPAGRLMRCFCSENHLGTICIAAQCFGQACITFNGTLVDARNRTTSVVYQSCEQTAIRNNRQINFNLEPNGKFCERTQFVENAANGPLHYSGKSCLCGSDKCNSLQQIPATVDSSRNDAFDRELNPFDIREHLSPWEVATSKSDDKDLSSGNDSTDFWPSPSRSPNWRGNLDAYEKSNSAADNSHFTVEHNGDEGSHFLTAASSPKLAFGQPQLYLLVLYCLIVAQLHKHLIQVLRD